MDSFLSILISVFSFGLLGGTIYALVAAGLSLIYGTALLPQAANEIWGVAKEGFEDACKAYGIEAAVVAPMKPNDINEMNALVETAIAEGVDGVITQAVNPQGQAPAFDKLDAAGIPWQHACTLVLLRTGQF